LCPDFSQHQNNVTHVYIQSVSNHIQLLQYSIFKESVIQNLTACI